MDVKRAVRCYRGPDDPGPFSDMINSMSFHCRHMKQFNPKGVFCLTAKVAEGYVKVLRVGDVDYIWTEGRADDYLVFASSWSPFIYLYTKEGELAWSVDPRTEGNEEAWYQSVYDAYYGGFNLTDLYSGDQNGFDLHYMGSLQWGYLVLLYRFSYTGKLLFYVWFPHNEVPNVARNNYEFAQLHYSDKGNYCIAGRTAWIHRSSSYEWFRISCTLELSRIEDNALVSIMSATLPNNPDADWFWMWGARWMEDEYFYVDLYGNKERYLEQARWGALYKFDYEFNTIASTDIMEFPTNAGHDDEADTGTGRLRTNDKYVIHFSTYGQYIRVWDKDLNFIKNVEVDPSIGRYGYSIAHYEDEKWCQLLGFIGDEAYIIVGEYAFPGEESPGEGSGWHTIYVYDISKDSGHEFQRTFRVYPPTVSVFGTTKQEVFDEGITLEGYKG